MNFKRSLFKQHLGLSLLELMLVLTVVATILLASTRFFRIATENAKVNNAVSMIHEITDASFKWYETNPAFDNGNFNFQTLVNMQLLPIKYFNPSKPAIKNPWNGGISIEAFGPEHFNVNMTGVPVVSCTKLKNQLAEYNANCVCTKVICKASFTF